MLISWRSQGFDITDIVSGDRLMELVSLLVAFEERYKLRNEALLSSLSLIIFAAKAPSAVVGFRAWFQMNDTLLEAL